VTRPTRDVTGEQRISLPEHRRNPVKDWQAKQFSRSSRFGAFMLAWRTRTLNGRTLLWSSVFLALWLPTESLFGKRK